MGQSSKLAWSLTNSPLNLWLSVCHVAEQCCCPRRGELEDDQGFAGDAASSSKRYDLGTF